MHVSKQLVKLDGILMSLHKLFCLIQCTVGRIKKVHLGAKRSKGSEIITWFRGNQESLFSIVFLF